MKERKRETEGEREKNRIRVKERKKETEGVSRRRDRR
jgi:hypothetical protein